MRLHHDKNGLALWKGRPIFKSFIGGLFALVLYLLFWPVPIDPQAWDAPVSPGYVGAFQANEALGGLTFFDLDGESGPEDVSIGPDGAIYAPVHSGRILKIEKGGKVSRFADPGGRVLGLEWGRDGALYAADAFHGLLKFQADGTFAVLSDKASDGTPILYANDLDVAADGVVYFSDASQKFGAKENGGTLPASLLEIAEHGGHGRVLKYDPATGQAHPLLTGLHFANGIALSLDETYLLIAETGQYRILKYWLKGEKAGQVEPLIENLPGFPDNIKRDGAGHFWVGLVSPRNRLLDFMAPYPFLRRLTLRLPVFMRPGPQRYGYALHITGHFSGKRAVLKSLQDPKGRYAMVTGAVEWRPLGEAAHRPAAGGENDDSPLASAPLIITSLTEGRLGILMAPSSAFLD